MTESVGKYISVRHVCLIAAQFGFVWPVSVGTIAAAHQCRTHDDCDKSLGQSCYWLYDGCQMGQCMCDPKRHRQEPSGHCTLRKKATPTPHHIVSSLPSSQQLSLSSYHHLPISYIAVIIFTIVVVIITVTSFNFSSSAILPLCH